MHTNSNQLNILEQQRKIFETRFNNASIIAAKPFSDLVEAFNAYKKVTDDLIAEQKREIVSLSDQVVSKASISGKT